MVNPKLVFPATRMPAYLKGLVDRRARADGELNRLAPGAAVARAALERAATKVEKYEGKLRRAAASRDSCDILLSRWSAELQTENISPVQASRGRYGELGALQQQMLVFVDAAGPAGIRTGVLGDQLIASFGLSFLGRQARTDWVNNSVANRLKVLVKQGRVERIPATGAGEKGKVWRAVLPETLSFNSLLQQAEVAGLDIKVGTKLPKTRK